MKRSSNFVLLAALLAFTVLLATGLFCGAGATNGNAVKSPDHITLTWTGDSATTMTVTWRTDAAVESGFVQYQEGTRISAEAQQAKAAARDFITDIGTSRLFTSTLVNLSPNTRFSYRVGDGDHWSDTHSFLTADPETNAFKFLIFGDSQAPVRGDAPYETWRNTVQNAYRANPDAKFMINVGDLVDFGQQEAHWNAWFGAAEGVIDRIPEMPVTGNHECYGSHDTRKPEFWRAQFVLPQNGPEGLKGQVYSFDYGPVHFAMLDSQQEEQKEYGDILEVQKTWLEADLAASKAAWKLVFFHKPPYGVMARRPNDDIKAAFCPILEKYHADLVFNGHDHAIARTYAINNGVFMEKPSQGTVYYMVGQSGGKTYKIVDKQVYNSFFYNPLDQPNYVVAEVKGEKITLKVLMQDGTLLDTFFIDKANDVSSDPPPEFSESETM
jgi:hypothetical protein